MKKVVIEVQIHGEKEKQKAMKAVSSLPGIESIAVDLKERKMTVIGDVDPVQVVGKLRKTWRTQILTVGPAKEEKKDGDKKDGDKKDGEKKDDKKQKSEKEQIEELLKLYKNYNPYHTPYYHVYSAEENPNACVIC